MIVLGHGDALVGRDCTGARKYAGAGYYLSKDLVDQAGHRFHPGLFAELGWYYDFWGTPERASVFTEAQLIAKDPVTGKLFNHDLGLGVRPFTRFLNLELRLGIESVYDFGVSKGRVLPYGGIRVTF